MCRECGYCICIHNHRKYDCRDCETGSHKNKGPREKYHITHSSDVVYLTWTDPTTKKQIKKRYRTTKIGLDKAFENANIDKQKLIEQDKLNL